jgi:hypothetical protein
VLKAAEQIKERLEREGVTVSENARLKEAAAHNDRASKLYDRAAMRERALELDTKHDNQARGLVRQVQERLPLCLAQEEIAIRAQEAVTFARDNALEREAVADMRQLMTDALRRNLGLTGPIKQSLRNCGDDMSAVSSSQLCVRSVPRKRLLDAC